MCRGRLGERGKGREVRVCFLDVSGWVEVVDVGGFGVEEGRGWCS